MTLTLDSPLNLEEIKTVLSIQYNIRRTNRFYEGTTTFFMCKHYWIFSTQDTPQWQQQVVRRRESVWSSGVELFVVLKRFRFGDISWIHIQASVTTNSIQSDNFPLQRETRQGCLLSPLLFALRIVPLSIALRSSCQFKGVTRGDKEFKSSLFGDDWSLYVSHPKDSIPSILSIFGRIRIIFWIHGKSIQSMTLLYHLSFKMSNIASKTDCVGFRYLGINITLTFWCNFSPFIIEIKADI